MRGHERGERAAKDQQQHHEQDRKRDQLALVERIERGLVDRPHERRQPGELGSSAAAATYRFRTCSTSGVVSSEICSNGFVT